jgi:hypothetical protein
MDIILGRRWITTFKKLPTISPSNAHMAARASGNAPGVSAMTVIAAFPGRGTRRGATNLEDQTA